jgi:hemerythrin superfamily protein
MTKQDPIEMLLEDHKKVQTLFNDFNKSEDEAATQGIVNKVCAELTVHAQLEEEIFYPAVREVIDNADLMDKAMVEHAAAKYLVHELEAMQASDALYKAKFTVLGEYVNHHIEEEQTQIFPKVKEAKIDLESLGREMADYKQELTAQQFEEDTGIIDELEQRQKDPDQLQTEQTSSSKKVR